MSNTYKIQAIELANEFFSALEYGFASESFLNAEEVKQWLGQNIKAGSIALYKNLEYKNYKAVLDVIKNGEAFHMGIDFGQQAVHVTIEPGNVYSLYYRMPFAQ